MADVDPLTLAVVLAVAIAAVAGAGLPLLAEDPGVGDASSIELRSCTAIDEPGRYVLAADITDSGADTCIRIRSSDVVLDGAGHTVDGVGAFGTAGVVVRPARGGPLSNVSVRNVTVTDWDDGIRFIDVGGGRVAGTTATNNRVGLSLLDARRIAVVDNVARDNRLRGISLFESSANNTLANNTADGNAVYGIHLVEPGVRNNTLVGNTASANEFGVVLVGARDNTLTDTTATDNRIAGIWLSTATGNVVSHSAVSGQYYGVFLSDRSNGNAVKHAVAESNAVGIRLRSSDDNAVMDNVVRSSSDTAILLISSDDNRVVGNTGIGNAHGIVRVRSTGNAVVNNSVR